jgi:hypothetical protein
MWRFMIFEVVSRAMVSLVYRPLAISDFNSSCPHLFQTGQMTLNRETPSKLYHEAQL